jgi:hypothetical protein
VTEDKISFSGKLETPWHNVDVTDPDTGEGHVVAIEVGGVLHQLPANFASTIQGTYGAFHTTHGTDGHDKWMYFADNGNPTPQIRHCSEHAIFYDFDVKPSSPYSTVWCTFLPTSSSKSAPRTYIFLILTIFKCKSNCRHSAVHFCR